ncbi:MAG: NAD(P)H-dependent oxidoreductase [Candidatus Magasanikbacteria bacterium]|nr:NAD(P)H-dependent oxidoreductase [Candidatus Magasanikbacteria bacterium]
MFIPIILGTAREGRQSEKAAQFVLEEVLKYGLESEILDVRDFRLPATDASKQSDVAKKLAEKITRADGLIVVSPEYNHGYPGELKMMLDMLYTEYAHKPLGICGVSMGGLGGVRMVEQLRQVATELHMVNIREAIYFSGIQNLFENGKIKDESFGGRVKTMLDELVWYANTLKQGIK